MIDNETMSITSEATNQPSKRRKTRALTLQGERRRANSNRTNRRNQMSLSTRSRIRELDTTSRIEARDNLSPTTSSRIREHDTTSRIEARENLTPITSSRIRNINTTNRIRARSNMSPTTQSQIRTDDAERTRTIRENETMLEREERLGLARQRRHQRRFTHANYKRAYFDPNEPCPAIPAYNIGSPDLVCKHCGSKYWAAELNTNREFTKCCQKGIILK